MKNYSKKGVFEFEMKKAFNRALTQGNRDGWYPFYNKTDLDEIKVCHRGKEVYAPITGCGLRGAIEDWRTFTLEYLREYMRG